MQIERLPNDAEYEDMTSTTIDISSSYNPSSSVGIPEYVKGPKGDKGDPGTTDLGFSSVGNGLKIVNEVLVVDSTDEAIEDNTQPITSGGVHTLVGNINALLITI